MYDTHLHLNPMEYFIFYTVVPGDLFSPFPLQHVKTFQLFLIFPNCPIFSTTQSYAPMYHFTRLFLNLSPVCWWKSFLFECWFCFCNPVFNFTCTFRIICYHAIQIAEIFHIRRLSLICRSLHYGMVVLSFLLSRVPRLFPIRRIFHVQSIQRTL